MGRATKFKPKNAAFFNYLIHNFRLYLSVLSVCSVVKQIIGANGQMIDVFFYEAFEEEARELRRLLPPEVRASIG